MGLFGGGSRRAAPPSTTRTHATQDGRTRTVEHRKSLEELTSPKSGQGSLPLPPPERRTPSPAPFDLHAAISLMQVPDDRIGLLPETINQTASYLANILISDDIFSAPPPESTQPNIKVEDIRALYIRGAAFANSKSDSVLRTAALRLLAALIATHPPAQNLVEGPTGAVPNTINARSLYRLIVAPTTRSSTVSRIDAIFVGVGALKSLTKNGQEVDGLDGIVGWLVKTLKEVTDDFASWCTKKEDSMQEWSNEERSKVRGSSSTYLTVDSPYTAPRPHQAGRPARSGHCYCRTPHRHCHFARRPLLRIRPR